MSLSIRARHRDAPSIFPSLLHGTGAAMLRLYDTLLSLPHGAVAPLPGAFVIATTIRRCVSGTLPVIASVEAASQPTLHPPASSHMEEKGGARDRWGGHGRMRTSGSCCPSGEDFRACVNETHERIKHDHQTETLTLYIVYSSLHQTFRKCYNAESIYPAVISQTSAKGGERMADPDLNDLHYCRMFVCSVIRCSSLRGITLYE